MMTRGPGSLGIEQLLQFLATDRATRAPHVLGMDIQGEMLAVAPAGSTE